MTEQELKRLLTDEFLTTLVEAVRVVGWSEGDWTENCAFARALFVLADKEIPAMSPYSDDEGR